MTRAAGRGVQAIQVEHWNFQHVLSIRLVFISAKCKWLRDVNKCEALLSKSTDYLEVTWFPSIKFRYAIYTWDISSRCFRYPVPHKCASGWMHEANETYSTLNGSSKPINDYTPKNDYKDTHCAWQAMLTSIILRPTTKSSYYRPQE